MQYNNNKYEIGGSEPASQPIAPEESPHSTNLSPQWSCASIKHEAGLNSYILYIQYMYRERVGGSTIQHNQKDMKLQAEAT